MTELSAAISQIVILFLIVILGFILSKVGYLDQDMSNKLSGILLNVTLPCMIIASVSEMDFASAQNQIPITVLLAILSFVVMIVVSLVLAFLMRVRKQDSSVYMFMGLCTNLGFMGIPVIASIYGNQSIILTSIFVMFQGIFMYSFGFVMLAATSEDTDKAKNFKIPWRAMVNPAMIASLLALALFFAQIHLPYILNEAMDMVGSITAPIAMMIIGLFLSTVRIKDLISDWRIYVFVIARQLLLTIAIFLIARMFISDPLVLGVLVMVFAMPVGSLVPLFSAQFHHDTMLATRGVVIGTAFSFVFIPVLLAVMTYC